MIKIAIDGPSASGKGTIAKMLASHLDLQYLNTGRIYRIVAFESAKQLTAPIKICQDLQKYWNNNYGDSIYSSENSLLTSNIASNPEIRSSLLSFQQDFAKEHEKVILEGRDICTVVMPFANYKFYLDASPEERARRRILQTPTGTYETILAEILQRDKQDTERSIGNLKVANDAVYIDSTKLDTQETFNKVLSYITPAQ